MRDRERAIPDRAHIHRAVPDLRRRIRGRRHQDRYRAHCAICRRPFVELERQDIARTLEAVGDHLELAVTKVEVGRVIDVSL